MRKETVLFFQELYQNSISQDKILDFCKIVQKMELEKEQSFFAKNIYLSERAQRIEKQFRVLEEQVEEAEMPADFLEIQKKLQILKETTQRYLLYSMKNLDQNVFLPEDMDVIFSLFDQYADTKIRRMYSYMMYYALCQNGTEIENYLDLHVETANEPKYVCEVLFAKWQRLFQFIEPEKMELWKYQQKLINLDKLGEVPQFVRTVQGKRTEGILPGNPKLSFESFGQTKYAIMNVAGKGNITNYNPERENPETNLLICSDRDLNIKDERILEMNFNENPLKVLTFYFDEKIFVISAEAYFRFANSCMILQRLNQIWGD